MITFGTDPEFFATYKKNGKEYLYPPVAFELEQEVTPIRIIKGENFDHPVYVEIDLNDKEQIVLMADGAAFEITVPPVNKNEPDKLFKYVMEGYKLGEEFFETFGFSSSFKPTIDFDLSKFGPANKEDNYWQACIFGCDPDFSAYDDKFKSSTFEVVDYPFRHAGGHLHVGVKEKELFQMILDFPKPIIQMMDLLVGNFSLVNSPYLEEEKKRMIYYGEAGKYRPTEYGFEYRSPSVSWTTKEEFYPTIFELSEIALKLFENPNLGKKALEKVPAFLHAYDKQDLGVLSEIREDIIKLV